MMERAIIVPTAKKPDAVPTHMAPSRSTAIGINGSTAVIIRQAKHAHSIAETRNSPKISGAPPAPGEGQHQRDGRADHQHSTKKIQPMRTFMSRQLLQDVMSQYVGERAERQVEPEDP